jgi:carboxypeptidase family protein
VSLRAIRIGFQPRELRLPAPRPLTSISLDLRMLQLPALLSTMKVSARKLCPGSEGRTDAFVLWEQARAGLLAAVVAREAKPATVTTLTFERALSPWDEQVHQLRVQARTGVTARPFLASGPPAEFVSTGYMQEDATGRTWHAPDADVMLDESFAATHCFHIETADNVHRDAIGLAFEPSPGRDSLVDVSGVLWLDRAVPALQELDFRFTSLEPAAVSASAGGQLTFRTMPNGVVFIERWVMRMPVLTLAYAEGSNERVTTRDQRDRTNRRNLRVSEVRERGGEVTSAQWPDGTRFDATPGKVSGRILKKGTQEPIPHALVYLDGSADTTSTDSTGRFSLSPVVPGRYSLKATDTTLAAYTPKRSVARVFEVVRDQESNITIELSPLDPRLSARGGTTSTQSAPSASVPSASVPNATPLPPVTILDSVRPAVPQRNYLSPGLRAFEERRARGLGHFISEETLRKNDGKPLTNVILQNIPGVMVEARHRSAAYLVSGRTQQANGPVFLQTKSDTLGNDLAMNCWITVYVDGIRIWDHSAGESARPDFNRLFADNYAGIEYYAGGATLPPDISPMNAECGVLLLWTREK